MFLWRSPGWAGVVTAGGIQAGKRLRRPVGILTFGRDPTPKSGCAAGPSGVPPSRPSAQERAPRASAARSAHPERLAGIGAAFTQKALHLPDGIERPAGSPGGAEQPAFGEPVDGDGADAERAPGFLTRKGELGARRGG